MPTTIVALLNHPIRPLSGIGWLRPMAPVVWCPARDGDQKLVGWRSALCNDCTAAASPDRPAGSPGRDTSLVAVICREEAGGGGDRTRGVPWRLGVALDRVTGVQEAARRGAREATPLVHACPALLSAALRAPAPVRQCRAHRPKDLRGRSFCSSVACCSAGLEKLSRPFQSARVPEAAGSVGQSQGHLL